MFQNLNLKNKFVLNKQILLEHGFEYNDKEFILRKTLSDEKMYVLIRITEEKLVAKVYDVLSREEYLPFNLINTGGAYLGFIRDEVNKIVEEIMNNCFFFVNIKDKVLDYIKNEYGTVPAFPWKKEDYATLNCKSNGKWYGLLMFIPYSFLGVDIDKKVDVINIKSDSVADLIDHEKIYPAYHMNKKHWITVVLDKISFEEIKPLIDKSYSLVDKKSSQI